MSILLRSSTTSYLRVSKFSIYSCSRCFAHQRTFASSARPAEQQQAQQDSSGFGNVRTSEIPLENSYDIVINGGGIVGFSFLAAIKSLPWLSTKRVLLIEQQPEPKYKPVNDNAQSGAPAFSNRVSAITGGSRKLFEDIGIWDSLEQYAKRIDGMHVWTDHYQNSVHFAAEDPQQEATCFILENSRISRALTENINNGKSGSDNLKVAYETSVTDLDLAQDDSGFDDATTSVLLKLDTANQTNSEIIQTKLLIGCDGFKSLTRSRSTLPYYQFEIQQMGIVGTVRMESPFIDNSVAFQRFVSDSLVIALLPLDSNHSSFVLSVQAKDLPGWMKLSDEDFVHRFNTEIVKETRSNPIDRIASQFTQSFQGLAPKQPISPYQARIPPIINEVLPGSRAAFPYGFGTTVPKLIGSIKTNNFLVRDAQKKFNFANTVIMGDAAHRVHPLAGQGLNLGLGDAAELAHQLESNLSQGYELFGPTVDTQESLTNALTQFERVRVTKLVPMMGAIHTMQTVMAWTPSSLLSLFNSLPWVKSQVVSYANSR